MGRYRCADDSLATYPYLHTLCTSCSCSSPGLETKEPADKKMLSILKRLPSAIARASAVCLSAFTSAESSDTLSADFCRCIDSLACRWRLCGYHKLFPHPRFVAETHRALPAFPYSASHNSKCLHECRQAFLRCLYVCPVRDA